MVIHKEISKDNEFYLYMNGKLIYKKWLDHRYSKVFDVTAYDKYTHKSITDLDFEDSPFILTVKAKVRFFTSAEGGRATPILDRYRPNHVFEYDANQELIEAFMGELVIENHQQLEIGPEYNIKVRFMMHPGLEGHLEKGKKWYLHEGKHRVGQGEVLAFLNEE